MWTYFWNLKLSFSSFQNKWLWWAQAPNASSEPLRAYIRYRTMLLSTQLVSTKRPLEDRSLSRLDWIFGYLTNGYWLIYGFGILGSGSGRVICEHKQKSKVGSSDARKLASPSLSRKHPIDRHLCLLTAAGWPVDRKLSAAYTGLRTTVMFPILSVGSWAYMHGHFQQELYSNFCVQLLFHWNELRDGCSYIYLRFKREKVFKINWENTTS
jgi:hypothetical protein